MTMRGWITGIGVLAAFLSACGGANDETRPPDWDGPVLHVDRAILDFGDAYSGVERKARIVLENRGRKPLVIKDVQAECGCSRPQLSAREIPPGMTATMDVAFLPPPIRGAVEKHIRLYTNDPYEATAVITIRANCSGPARLEPSVIEMPSILPVDGFHRRLHLTLPETKSLRALEFSSSFPWARVRILGDWMRRREADLELIVDRLPGPSQLAEVIQVVITAEDALGRVSTFALPNGLQLVGSVEPVVWAVPAVVNLGVLEASRGARGEFRLEGPRAEEFAVAEIVLDGVEGATVENQGGGVWVMTIPDREWRGRLTGEIRLRAATGLTVSVPVLGYGGTW